MIWARVKRFMVGEPLSSHMASGEKIPKWKALAVMSSDALSSVAYATEEILIPLAAVAILAVSWSVPISLAIVSLMLIVTVSYRQTIEAYSNGGGAYVVSKENLGIYPALVAGAALLIGYVLTVSVSIAAGVTALTSAFPELLPFKVPLGCLGTMVVTVLNLRGIRESATIFAFPTYAFLILFFVMLGAGAWQLMSGTAQAVEPVFHDSYAAVPIFLLFRAFSSGCAALTGIEAISNGVPAFRVPQARNAKITLTWMALILSILFFGVTALSHSFGIMPTEGEAAVSQLARSIFGTGPMYYMVQVATALILLLAANTSYAGFPWLTAILAKDGYLPRQFAILGDRLVYSNSIVGLGVAAAILIVIFDGDPHSLIPLYAVGVFLGFTLSQAGMVIYHRRERTGRWRRGLAINLFGAVTTFVVMCIVGASKFTEGAWIVAILIPVLVYAFKRIKGHYLDVGRQLTLLGVEAPPHLEPLKHTAVIPISGVHRGVIEALKYALSISDDVRAVYVEIDPEASKRMRKEWDRWGHDIPFVVLRSPYRSVIRPILEYLDDLDQTAHGDLITVVIPEFVAAKWWHNVLHNQTALMIRAALMFKKNRAVTTVRYHLKKKKVKRS